MEHRCPVCKKTFSKSVQEASGDKGFLPFCCERCKLVDLGAWLNSEYRIDSGSNSEENAEPLDTDNPYLGTQ